jgi:hypothetical protein
MDMQTVSNPHCNRKHRILANVQEHTLALKPEAFLQIGVVCIQIHIPQVLDINHMLIALFGILIV